MNFCDPISVLFRAEGDLVFREPQRKSETFLKLKKICKNRKS